MPTGRQKVNSPPTLCVSKRGGRQGKNSPKSGTMAPTMTADSSRQRASKREKGRTAAAWEMVNGINEPCCHLIVTKQTYKLRATPYPLTQGSQHVQYRCDQSSAGGHQSLSRGNDADRAKTQSLVQCPGRRRGRRRDHLYRHSLGG